MLFFDGSCFSFFISAICCTCRFLLEGVYSTLSALSSAFTISSKSVYRIGRFVAARRGRSSFTLSFLSLRLLEVRSLAPSTSSSSSISSSPKSSKASSPLESTNSPLVVDLFLLVFVFAVLVSTVATIIGAVVAFAIGRFFVAALGLVATPTAFVAFILLLVLLFVLSIGGGQMYLVCKFVFFFRFGRLPSSNLKAPSATSQYDNAPIKVSF